MQIFVEVDALEQGWVLLQQIELREYVVEEAREYVQIVVPLHLEAQ